MFENVDGRTTDAGVIGILIAHLGAFGSGELISKIFPQWRILVLHFGENFVKILTKISKLQMHENLHKNVNENSHFYTDLLGFYEWQLKEQICYSFTLLISYIDVF